MTVLQDDLVGSTRTRPQMQVRKRNGETEPVEQLRTELPLLPAGPALPVLVPPPAGAARGVAVPPHTGQTPEVRDSLPPHRGGASQK